VITEAAGVIVKLTEAVGLTLLLVAAELEVTLLALAEELLGSL
jgi:hypothetical protein